MNKTLNNNQKNIIILLSVIVAIISLGYSFYFQIKPSVDARAYDKIAWNIIQGNGYRENLGGPLSGDQSIIRVGPGYEFFLVGIYYIFGHHYYPVWIIQALIMALSFWIVFLLSREIFKENISFYASLIAAILIGFSPDLITIQGMLMSEILGVFLVIVSIFLFFKYFNDNNKPLWLTMIIGIMLGMAGLVRTPALFLILPIGGYFIWIKKYKHFAVFILSTIILFIPWTIRNYNVFHEFVPTNAAGGINLLIGNHSGANGEQGDVPPILDKYMEDYGFLAADKNASKEAINFIIKNPLQFLKITAKRISVYFSFARPTAFWPHLKGLSKIITLISSSIYSMILFILGSWGIFQSFRLGGRDAQRSKILLVMLLMMPLSIIGIVVETRYRFLVYPFFAIFSGFAVERIISKKMLWKPAVLIAFLFFLNTAIDVVSNWARILGKIKIL